MAEKPWKIKPGPEVKFMKFSHAIPASRRRNPRREPSAIRLDGLDRIAGEWQARSESVSLRAVEPGSFEVSASHEVKKLRTPAGALRACAAGSPVQD